MKTASEVSAAKLRGGFYSPAELVAVCLDRVHSLLGTEGERLRVLEPSAGDGAFIAGLAQHPLAEHVDWVTALEPMHTEAAACRQRLETTGLAGEVRACSALRWAATDTARYDVAVGNPPFVRFQFVGDDERRFGSEIGARYGLEFRGVSNLWLPVFVAALGALRLGGAFAFIVPAESFTGVSAQPVRDWLLANVESLHVDLFPPGSFTGVLQEVVVLSGRVGTPATRDLCIRDHAPGARREWRHRCIGASRTWTRYLLSPQQLATLQQATTLPAVSRLGALARFEVATVTGANGFFCVDDSTLHRSHLERWARPLLARTRHAPGLAYTAADHSAARRLGLPAHLLDFGADAPDPLGRPGPGAYLASGERLGLPARYKCRIREPWFRVPVVPAGALLMAKRSHRYPRVIVNEAGAFTTDTIYRGRLLPGTELGVREFAAAFHNSLTLLSAEIEGRSFGGGVLELVPSEIAQLAMPLPVGMADEFARLDGVCRTSGGSEALVEESDALVVNKTPGLTGRLMTELAAARHTLLGLRLARG